MYNRSGSDRRKIKIRKKIAKQDKFRLTVYKSNKHIYAQLFEPNGSRVIASASSLDKKFKDKVKEFSDLNKKMSKTDEALFVGELLAAVLRDRNILTVVFDRSGFKFHGRIKAVAESMLKNGIKC